MFRRLLFHNGNLHVYEALGGNLTWLYKSLLPLMYLNLVKMGIIRQRKPLQIWKLCIITILFYL